MGPFSGIDATMFVLLLFIGVLVLLLWRRVLYYRRASIALRDELQKQRENLEQQVEKAKEAVQAKSDFLSKMSHEIRTPLNAIIGMTQIAMDAPTLDKAKTSIGKVEESSKHLLGILNDILDFSKIEAGSLVLEERFFSLRGDVEFVLSMLRLKAVEKGVDLRAVVDEIRHDGIEADMLRLNQVLINLLSNAIKFTDAGGTVILEVEELVHVEGESAYRFIVRDNGVGIAPEQARKLFTPFTQANAGVARIYGGTGLGLAISQSIVRMMGGDIELETEPGKGSVFHFTIRVPAQEEADPHGEDDEKELRQDAGCFAGKRILIVDDIEINREVVAGLLDGSGALIEMAANGKEALDAYLNAEAGRFDLILMDVQMPVMDGCETTQAIRASGRPDAGSVRIVAMTANVMQEDVDRAYASGIDAYVAKPVEASTLYQVMKEWL